MDKIWYTIADFFQFIFKYIEMLGNSVNYLYIVIIFVFLGNQVHGAFVFGEKHASEWCRMIESFLVSYSTKTYEFIGKCVCVKFPLCS